MYDKDWKGISYTGGFFILIAFVIGGFVLANLISTPVWTAMTGKSMQAITDNATTPADAGAMKVVQTITAILGFFIPTVVTAMLLHRKPFRLLGFVKGVKLNQAGLTILILGASLLVAASLSYMTHYIPLPETWKVRFDRMEVEYSRQIAGIIQLRNTTDYILALVVLGFIPALCEETVFRGGLQNFLTRGSRLPWVSIIVVSILFSLAHSSFYLFLSRFFLGLMLGAIFYYSGNLWLSILAHFINNAITLTVLFITIQQGKTLQQAMESGSGSPWGLLALPVLAGLLWMFRRVTPVRRQSV